MKMKKLLLYFIGLCFGFEALAQVTVSPSNPTPDQEITITYDAAQGVSGLKGATKVYMHAGAVLWSPVGTDWSNVVGNWGMDDNIGLMQRVENQIDKWQIKLTPRQYFKLRTDQKMFRMGMVFRNATGSQTGKSPSDGDIFVDLAVSFFLRSTNPPAGQTTVFAKQNEKFTISVEANQSAALTLLIDNQVVRTETSNKISHDFTPTTSQTRFVSITGKAGNDTDQISFTMSIVPPVQTAERPAGLRDGINYISDTQVVLSLFAPEKDFVYVVGDFNNWQNSPDYLMRKTPDGKRFWLQINNLTPRKEYVFQYLVNGSSRMGDPYSELIVDPWNDQNINFLVDERTPFTVYSSLPQYPADQPKELASVIQTAQTPYQWKITNFQKPKKEDLVIYELLVRDFDERHSFQAVIERLPYLKTLGINAIQLMPVMEFENNNSWGYNPSYHLAVDKYYGKKNDLKALIDAAHAEGMAVILDMVLNHAFGQSPLVRLYWDSQTNQPAANSPYFNQVARHPFNVGFDFNHESAATQEFVDRVNEWWLKEYKFDGFRFDLSKGFTQTQSSDDGVFRRRDAGRIAILKRMADQLWKTDPEAYVILEHFAEDAEEKELSNMGMMLWGNHTHDFAEASANGNGNFGRLYYLGRGWERNGLVGYMESHDEERMMIANYRNGVSNGNYDTRTLATACERIKMAATFYFLCPGQKMLWQFEELGYDVSINDGGRLGRKPIRWNYLDQPDRKKLYQTFSELIKLKTSYEVFRTGRLNWKPFGTVRTMTLLGAGLNVVVIGNFGSSEALEPADFPNGGKWYDYFTGKEIEVTDVRKPFLLQAGEFHIFTDKPLPKPQDGIVAQNNIVLSQEMDWYEAGIFVYPNPAKDHFQIRRENLASEPLQIQLFDLYGKQVLEKQTFSQNVEIRTADFSKGMYFLQIRLGKQVLQKKIVLE